MKLIGGTEFELEAVFPKNLSVPDSFVVRDNKIRTTLDKAQESHGEAKLYISSKDVMRDFYGGEGFEAPCFMLKQDLITYLNTLKEEYLRPSQDYRGGGEFPRLWQERMNKVQQIPEEIILFTVSDQVQIRGNRGYVNSNDWGYKLIRELSLPLVSFILVKKLIKADGEELFYWKLFVDFDAIEQMKSLSLVFSYGKGRQVQGSETLPLKTEAQVVKRGRDGQQKYREQLLEQCPFCPFTMVTDDRLLIASHIKPWAVSNEKEKIDPYNGYMLTPTYDRLFDQGFITFTEDRCLHISDYLSNRTCKQLGLQEGQFIQMLPMDEHRKAYLSFHRQSVFKD